MGVDVEFRRQVLDMNIKATLQFCYQCNRCTTECPISNNIEKPYNPKQLMLESLLGLKDDIIHAPDNFNVFGCTICDTCDEVCPGDLELTEVFYLLKNLMVQAGNAPKAYIAQAKTIANNAYSIPLQQAIARRRTQLGLPEPVLAEASEVQTILNEVGFTDRVKLE